MPGGPGSTMGRRCATVRSGAGRCGAHGEQRSATGPPLLSAPGRRRPPRTAPTRPQGGAEPGRAEPGRAGRTVRGAGRCGVGGDRGWPGLGLGAALCCAPSGACPLDGPWWPTALLSYTPFPSCTPFPPRTPFPSHTLSPSCIPFPSHTPVPSHSLFLSHAPFPISIPFPIPYSHPVTPFPSCTPFPIPIPFSIPIPYSIPIPHPIPYSHSPSIPLTAPHNLSYSPHSSPSHTP